LPDVEPSWRSSGASAIAIVDLNQADADAAAADLVDWFGELLGPCCSLLTFKSPTARLSPERLLPRAMVAMLPMRQASPRPLMLSSNSGARLTWVHSPDVVADIQSLVTAAGIVENFVALEYPTEKVRKLMDINVMGTWFCAREAAKRMEKGGSIVMIGSMSGSVRSRQRLKDMTLTM
jgi:D-arabinitol 2-dehydrogenase